MGGQEQPHFDTETIDPVPKFGQNARRCTNQGSPALSTKLLMWSGLSGGRTTGSPSAKCCFILVPMAM
ncbi:hypothetical protein GCM10010869_20270 [Mesorhizobium tianshanense]|nr:hypothetical protein [Mesorhizobium tianshanense]GLS36438.1 hypothetical protein GCM10010869_20270 [Mesorhizobium tianshanense]